MLKNNCLMDILLDIGDLASSGTSFKTPLSFHSDIDYPQKVPLHPVDFGTDNDSTIYGRAYQFVDINITAELQESSQFINESCRIQTCATVNVTSVEEDEPTRNWMFLLLILLVLAGGLGNILVCLAICMEKRLQNVTNYFLLSLAVADLLVCVAVMPFGILEGFFGM